MCIQLEKAELRSDRISAEALEGACIGSGVGSLVSPLELALYGASLCLDLVAVSQSHHGPSCPVLWKPSEVIVLGTVFFKVGVNFSM